MNFNLNILRDYSINYSYSDFEALFYSVYLNGFLDPSCEREAILMLYLDYKNKRSNAFAYLNDKKLNASEIMELRLSAILRLPKEFYINHPIENENNIHNYRVQYLQQFFKYYSELPWQYYFFILQLIPKENRNDLEFFYEHLINPSSRPIDMLTAKKEFVRIMVYND